MGAGVIAPSLSRLRSMSAGARDMRDSWNQSVIRCPCVSLCRCPFVNRSRADPRLMRLFLKPPLHCSLVETFPGTHLLSIGLSTLPFRGCAVLELYPAESHLETQFVCA